MQPFFQDGEPQPTIPITSSPYQGAATGGRGILRERSSPWGAAAGCESERAAFRTPDQCRRNESNLVKAWLPALAAMAIVVGVQTVWAARTNFDPAYERQYHRQRD